MKEDNAELCVGLCDWLWLPSSGVSTEKEWMKLNLLVSVILTIPSESMEIN